MITLGALLTFLGFFAVYNTSRKAVLSGNSKPELWLRANGSGAKLLASSSLIAALVLFASVKGICAGTLLFFVTLMLSGSLVVLLSPLRMIRFGTVTIVFALALLAELLNLV